MLFDERPKERANDLYGRDSILHDLISRLRKPSDPVLILLGVRRVGKTSLLKTALNEARISFIYVDARRFDVDGYTMSTLYSLLSEQLTRLRRTGKLKKSWELLKQLRGVSVAGVGVTFDPGEKTLLPSSVLKAINDGQEQVVIAIDEAQKLSKMIGRGRPDFRSLIAYAYDNLPNMKFVLTGSEVGLLEDFLKQAEDLQGREMEEIVVPSFDHDTAKRYLKKGFAEKKIKQSDEMLEAAVANLDGIVGWLAFYGRQVTKSRSQPIEKTLKQAEGIVEKEMFHLLQRSKYYRPILNAVANGSVTWSAIKNATRLRLSIQIDNNTITEALENLQKVSIIGKEGKTYTILDPIVMKYARLV